jgi:hypothetical protein
MDSSILASAARGWWADPFLWAVAAALLAGIAAGQELGAVAAPVQGRIKAQRRRSRRIARAIAYLSLGILASTALFVFADKAALAEAWAGVLLPCSAIALVVGLCSGFRPLVLGLPLAILFLAALFILGLGLEGWLPLRPGSGEASAPEIARLLPFDVGSGSFRGQLELPERDSAPVAREVGLASTSVGIRVESLELRGPLRLAISIVRPTARSAAAADSTRLRFYRVIGIAAPGSATIATAFAAPRSIGILDLLLPLPAGEGLEPTVSREGIFGLALRRRLSSPPVDLVLLQPVSFRLRADGSALIAK